MAKILVVEDDADILKLIRTRLEKADHAVVVTMFPDEALELSGDENFDLAILDVGLPGMSGLELLTQLRSQSGKDELPAIFLSARVQDEDIAAGEALGAIYLTKPFVASALLAAVDGVVQAGIGR